MTGEAWAAVAAIVAAVVKLALVYMQRRGEREDAAAVKEAVAAVEAAGEAKAKIAAEAEAAKHGSTVDRLDRIARDPGGPGSKPGG